MVSSASYPELYGDATPAVMNPLTYAREFPAAGIDAVSISDDLEAPAIANLDRPALVALNAGLDLLLYAQNESTSARAYQALNQDLQTGALSPSKVKRAADAIRALKASLNE
jgi:beta-glucosidase-like glycosyl hydrolase